LTEIKTVRVSSGWNGGMDAGFIGHAEHCPESVIVTDHDGRIEYVNATCERVTGYPRDELIGRTPALLKSGAHEADFYRSLWSALLAGREFRAVFTNRRKNGELYYEEKFIRPLGAGFVSCGRDVTEHAQALQRLAHAATHDSLTGLPNRSLFLDRLAQALREAQRRREPVTVAVLDVDRFREANNRHGHLAGDAALQAVAARIRSCVRDVDTVARIGGDEFGLILVGAGADAAGRVLEKIVAANTVPVSFREHELPLSVSVGACTYPEDGADELELRERADLKMYEAKRAGGNRYVL
jgi:diguanylate cyclase (GGDEF)-like protein/PAS domain S-box-containing protein